MEERYITLASQVEEAARQRAIDAASLATKPQTHPDFDGENCIRCGDAIPTERLDMGRIRCVPCQEHIERMTCR